MTRLDLNTSEYDPYYSRYVEKLPENLPLRQSFEMGKGSVVGFFKGIPEIKQDYRYAEKKWNCKEILQHLVDTERIFQYRCFRIARNDKTELAGFDQNIYNLPSMAKAKTMEELIFEFKIVRESSISLLNSLRDDDLKNIGIANGGPMSARAAAFTITGHEIWHMETIAEKYL
ncbi:DinB family protein [uncultured Croceitalea sp.]|uniref:DinB family protein n=1 Tax=uncultured Croceitalea sp. TaxID=1798908 RepID=UPI003305812C